MKILAAFLIGFCLFSTLCLSDTITSCMSDNTTLQRNHSLYYNATWYNFSERVTCIEGCDNTTMTCSQPEYVNALWILVIVIIILGVIYWVVKH